MLFNTSTDISTEDLSSASSSTLSDSLGLSRGTSAPHCSVEQRSDGIDGENSFTSEALIEGDEDYVNSDLDISHLVSSNAILVGRQIGPITTEPIVCSRLYTDNFESARHGANWLANSRKNTILISCSIDLPSLFRADDSESDRLLLALAKPKDGAGTQPTGIFDTTYHASR